MQLSVMQDFTAKLLQQKAKAGLLVSRLPRTDNEQGNQCATVRMDQLQQRGHELMRPMRGVHHQHMLPHLQGPLAKWVETTGPSSEVDDGTTETGESYPPDAYVPALRLTITFTRSYRPTPGFRPRGFASGLSRSGWARQDRGGHGPSSLPLLQFLTPAEASRQSAAAG